MDVQVFSAESSVTPLCWLQVIAAARHTLDTRRTLARGSVATPAYERQPPSRKTMWIGLFQAYCGKIRENWNYLQIAFLESWWLAKDNVTGWTESRPLLLNNVWISTMMSRFTQQRSCSVRLLVIDLMDRWSTTPYAVIVSCSPSQQLGSQSSILFSPRNISELGINYNYVQAELTGSLLAVVSTWRYVESITYLQHRGKRRRSLWKRGSGKGGTK